METLLPERTYNPRGSLGFVTRGRAVTTSASRENEARTVTGMAVVNIARGEQRGRGNEPEKTRSLLVVGRLTVVCGEERPRARHEFVASRRKRKTWQARPDQCARRPSAPGRHSAQLGGNCHQPALCSRPAGPSTRPSQPRPRHTTGYMRLRHIAHDTPTP